MCRNVKKLYGVLFSEELQLKCKILINVDSGNCGKIDVEKIKDILQCPNAQVQRFGSNCDWHSDDCDTVVICGGDGSLNHALQKARGKRIFYVPCGTLNECKRLGKEITTIGNANGMPFGYVCATGSFTEIGYSAKNKHKQKLKALAYLPQVIKQYKNHKIQAKIQVDEKTFDGEYTLIMAIKSKQCFGLPFNRCYDKNKGLYLLGIKSFSGNDFATKIKMFPTFFRIFFCGISKPTVNSRWFLLPCKNAKITLSEPQDFCFDGECVTLKDTIFVTEQAVSPPIKVILPY